MYSVDDFFKHINELVKVNKKKNNDFSLTPRSIYNELIYFGMQESEDIRHLFNRWIDRFSKRPGITAFKNGSFCQFVTGHINLNDSFKLYISLDKKNIDENVTKIFEYLRSNNINHVSKVSSSIRCDDLIIRVDSIKNVEKISDFIRNEKIDSDISSTILFTLKENKIGVVKDSIYAYLFEVSKIICECLNKNIKLTSKVFLNYLSQRKAYVRDENLKQIYKVCMLALSKDASIYQLDDIKIDGKANSKILNEVLKKTKDKYGVNHIKSALLKYIEEGNSLGFTRGDGLFSYRQLLVSRLSKEDVKSLISLEVGKSLTNKKLVEKYINLKFANEISQAKEKRNKKKNIIFDSCCATYKKHGYDYALGALKAYRCGSLELFDISEKQFNSLKLITKEEIEEVLKEIIVDGYPNVSCDEIKQFYKKGLIENMILNLVKGYIDIQ